jgi:hypothetical protein
MLSLLDPVEFENTFIFRDDVDSRKFYPLPDEPVILSDEHGNPEFLFIKYMKNLDETADADKDLGGGILQFRTTLTMKPERREKILSHLREQLEQEKAAGRKPFGHAIDTTEPLLAEPLWTSGKVSLATFKVSDTGIVRYASDGAPVDLAGGLGASVSLQLDDKGAEIFWSAYKDGKVPIMVTYQLKYRARISATMTIHADRQLIQQKILDQARPYVLMKSPFLRYVPLPTAQPFAMSQLPALRKMHGATVMPMVARQLIQDTIHQSIVKNEIKVTITSDEGTSAQGSSDVRDAMFKLATQMLSDRVVPALFGENNSQPGASSSDQSHPNVDLVQVQEAAAGGNISFDLSFDHQATKDDCEVNPNGPIQLLIANDKVRESCFKELRLTDGFFHAMNVTACTNGVNFKEDGVETVHVFLKYSQKDDSDPATPTIVRTKDDLLKSEQEAIHWRFDMARNADGAPKKTYNYMTEVFYREGPPSRSEWTPSTADKLLITPRTMGALRVELQLTAPEAEVSSAKVLLQHQAQTGSVFKETLDLTPKDPKKTWFQYTGDLAGNDADINPPEYTYQVIYRVVGGGEITMPLARSNAKTLEIPRPFAKTLKFTLLPQGSFDGVRDISGDFRYQDEPHNYSFIQSFQLTSLSSSVAINVPVLDGGPQKARWQARVNRSDGSSVDLGSDDAAEGNVFIGRGNVLKVEFNTDQVDFDKQIQLAVVVMRYSDPANNIAEHKTFTFSKSTKAQQSWIVNRAAGGPSKYDADIRFIAYDRSKNREIKFNQIDDDLLLLDPAAVQP